MELDREKLIKRLHKFANGLVSSPGAYSSAAEMLEADEREIKELRAEIERLKQDNEVLKGFVERNK